MRLAPYRLSISNMFTLPPGSRQAMAEKLGRCARCMRLSAGLAAGSWLLLAGVLGVHAGSWFVLVAAASVAIFTAWSVAHGLAYVARGPARAQGCRSCEERAKARRRKLKWRRRWSWFRARKPIAATRQSAGCQHCSEKKALENDYALADMLPPADADLRAVVESSPAFLSLLPRLAARDPVETWRVGMRNYFAYELNPGSDGLPASALLVARWEDDAPMSALVITGEPGSDEVRVVDLRAPTTTQTVALGGA